jgi:hypothetical protein
MLHPEGACVLLVFVIELVGIICDFWKITEAEWHQYQCKVITSAFSLEEHIENDTKASDGQVNPLYIVQAGCVLASEEPPTCDEWTSKAGDALESLAEIQPSCRVLG